MLLHLDGLCKRETQAKLQRVSNSGTFNLIDSSCNGRSLAVVCLCSQIFSQVKLLYNYPISLWLSSQDWHLMVRLYKQEAIYMLTFLLFVSISKVGVPDFRRLTQSDISCQIYCRLCNFGVHVSLKSPCSTDALALVYLNSPSILQLSWYSISNLLYSSAFLVDNKASNLKDSMLLVQYSTDFSRWLKLPSFLNRSKQQQEKAALKSMEACEQNWGPCATKARHLLQQAQLQQGFMLIATLQRQTEVSYFLFMWQIYAKFRQLEQEEGFNYRHFLYQCSALACCSFIRLRQACWK